MFDGDRRADITVRLPETVRADIDGLDLPVTVARAVVPLQELVTLSENIG